MKNTITTLLLLIALVTIGKAQTAKEIVTKMNDNAYGGKVKSSMKMTIVRPKWSRTMALKSWANGDDYSMILITSPAREKGIAYLKRKREMWNYQPTINRTIKMPPSMMMQSWMGSDFKNDDLVRQSSIVDDYTHKLLGKETIEGRECYKISSVPDPDAPVVWGKVVMWVDVEEYIQLKAESFDEDNDLVQTMFGQKIKEMGGRTMATKMVLEPADKEGHKTIMEYEDITFDADFDNDFFSVQNMKRLR